MQMQVSSQHLTEIFSDLATFRRSQVTPHHSTSTPVGPLQHLFCALCEQACTQKDAQTPSKWNSGCENELRMVLCNLQNEFEECNGYVPGFAEKGHNVTCKRINFGFVQCIQNCQMPAYIPKFPRKRNNQEYKCAVLYSERNLATSRYSVVLAVPRKKLETQYKLLLCKNVYMTAWCSDYVRQRNKKQQAVKKTQIKNQKDEIWQLTNKGIIELTLENQHFLNNYKW